MWVCWVRFNFVITCAQSHSHPVRAGAEEEALTVFMAQLGQYLGLHQRDTFTLRLGTPAILHPAELLNSGKWASLSALCVISVTLSVLAPVTKLPPSGRKSVISSQSSELSHHAVSQAAPIRLACRRLHSHGSQENKLNSDENLQESCPPLLKRSGSSSSFFKQMEAEKLSVEKKLLPQETII